MLPTSSPRRAAASRRGPLPLLLLLAGAVGASWLGPRVVPADEPEDFEAFRRRQREATSGASITVLKESDAAAAADATPTPAPVALEDPTRRFAGLVDHHALTVATLRRRAKARLNPGLEEVLVEEEYEKAIGLAEEDLLREWAVIATLALEAEAIGITASEQEIDVRLEELAEAGGRPGEPGAVLEGFGLDLATFRRELRLAVLVEKHVLRHLDQVADAELRRTYDQHLDSFYRPERVRVRAIVQDLSRALSDDDFREQFATMKAARLALDAGRSFGDVAREFSGAPVSRYRGGDMGWILRENRLPLPFRHSLFDLPPKKVTDVLRSDDGRFLYIFEVLEKRPAEVVPFEAAREDVKMLLYDDMRATLYEQTRRRHRIILNSGGIPEKYMEKVDAAKLETY